MSTGTELVMLLRGRAPLAVAMTASAQPNKVLTPRTTVARSKSGVFGRNIMYFIRGVSDHPKNRSASHWTAALAGLLLSWWHRALRRDASAARVGGSCAAVTAPATTMTVRALRLRTAEPSGWAQKLRGVCL